jgi:Cu+-exporting ATPase
MHAHRHDPLFGHSGHGHGHDHAHARELPEFAAVTDPVCGMQVDRAKALRLEHAGRTYFFCSEHCRGRFEADPEALITGGARARTPAHAHSQ